MSWLGGIGPVDWAPIFGYCFWLGISDNTALVHSFLVGLALKNGIPPNPSWILLVKSNGRRWFGWNWGGTDLGIGENLRGMVVEKTMDLTILSLNLNLSGNWIPSSKPLGALLYGMRWRWLSEVSSVTHDTRCFVLLLFIFSSLGRLFLFLSHRMYHAMPFSI